jgi:hypothetical protein
MVVVAQPDRVFYQSALFAVFRLRPERKQWYRLLLNFQDACETFQEKARTPICPHTIGRKS